MLRVPKRREPPAIPEAPQAEIAETTLRIKAVAKSTSIPKVVTAASVKTLIVTAAPAMLIVDPRGIETRIGIRIQAKVLTQLKVNGDISR